MKKVIVLIICIFLSLLLNAQNHLLLLNDSTLKIGKIVQSNDSELVMHYGNEKFSILKSSIDKVFEIDEIALHKKHRHFSFYSIADVGVLAGKRDEMEKYSFSTNMINGLQYKNNFWLGLGFGIEFMDMNIIPLFGDLRYCFSKGTLQPFVGIQGGFVLPLEEAATTASSWNNFDYQKGSFYSPLLGFKANLSTSNAFLLTLGFRHMKIVGERYEDWWEEIKYEREFIYDRFVFRVGYIFQ